MNIEVKNISELSAEELYALAREREQHEIEQRQAERREKLEALKAQRKELVARHRKELGELDRELQALGGRVPKGRAAEAQRRGASGGPTISQQLCDIVATQPEMTVPEIREKAEAAGIDTKNISQTLAYLKRQERLLSPRRGVYTAA